MDIRDDAIPTDLPENVPEEIRRKAKALAKVKVSELRMRVRAEQTRMTPKKSKQLEAQSIAKGRVEAARRKVWRGLQDRGAGVPDYDQPSQVGPWDGYYEKRIPPVPEVFTPSKNVGYNNPAPQGQIELLAVPPDEVEVVASDAVDHWMDPVDSKTPVDKPMPSIPVDIIPAFSAHPISPVDYPYAEFGGLGELQEEALSQQKAKIEGKLGSAATIVPLVLGAGLLYCLLKRR